MITINQQSVNVNRQKLLECLRTNRDNHVREYNQAVDCYQEAMVDALKKKLKEVRSGKVKELSINLPRPKSFESNYTDVIEMLEMSVDENINLDSSAFKAYIRDEWNWSQGFKSIAGSYVRKL